MLRGPLSSCQLSSSSGYFNILYIMRCEFIRILRKINVIILILNIEPLEHFLTEKGNRMSTSSSSEISGNICRDCNESLSNRLLSKRGAPSASSKSLHSVSSLLFEVQLFTCLTHLFSIDLLLSYARNEDVLDRLAFSDSK